MAGRGQRGSGWQSEPGKNLTLSIILKPHFLSIRDQFYLNVFASLAIRDYLLIHKCTDSSIKWPNDIFLGDKKVCGILIENQVSGSRIDSSVVGIGLNINQQAFGEVKATSLAMHKHQTFELPKELETLLPLIESRYLQLREGRLELLLRDYLESLYWINEEHTFESAKRGQFVGVIKGVDNSGQLRVAIEGSDTLFGVKELVYVR